MRCGLQINNGEFLSVRMSPVLFVNKLHLGSFKPSSAETHPEQASHLR